MGESGWKIAIQVETEIERGILGFGKRGAFGRKGDKVGRRKAIGNGGGIRGNSREGRRRTGAGGKDGFG